MLKEAVVGVKAFLEEELVEIRYSEVNHEAKLNQGVLEAGYL